MPTYPFFVLYICVIVQGTENMYNLKQKHVHIMRILQKEHKLNSIVHFSILIYVVGYGAYYTIFYISKRDFSWFYMSATTLMFIVLPISLQFFWFHLNNLTIWNPNIMPKKIDSNYSQIMQYPLSNNIDVMSLVSVPIYCGLNTQNVGYPNGNLSVQTMMDPYISK